MLINFARYARLIKQGITDYRWLLFYIQRMEYNPNRRILISNLIAKFLPKTQQDEMPENLPESRIIQEDGVVLIEDFISSTQLEEMRSYLATKSFSDPDRPELGTFTAPDLASKLSVHAYYNPEDILGTPHLLELINHPKILSVVESKLGAKPTISAIFIWWLLHGFDPEANSNLEYVVTPTLFHRDKDDWAEVKLFIYLTDVDESSGAHAFIKSSHRWVLPARTSVLDLDSSDFPMRDNLITLTGKAGMSWLENSYVLHRATVATQKHRLMIAVTYSLFPLPFSPSKPVLTNLNPEQFDPYINRVYLKYP